MNAFLSKRNFKVHTETDVRDALLKIIELQPAFVFIAWDHQDKKVTTMPTLIAQASAATVVPFISTNTNEAIIKFSSCTLNPKLFPPLSGPAVERLVLKTARHDIDQQAKQEKIRIKLKDKEELELLKKKMIDDLDRTTEREMETSFQNKAGSIEGALSPELDLQPPPPPPDALESIKKPAGFVIQKGFKHNIDIGSIIQKSGLEETTGRVIERLPIRAYCISILNENWCGYFVISSKLKLDFASINSIFADWIKLQVGSEQPLLEKDFFEFDTIDQSRLSVIEGNAEYSEKMQVENQDVKISFFKVSPDNMLVERNVDNGYIKIRTLDVPVGEKLDFSLLIHLPENKKYILYTAANSALEPEQKERLIKNKIEVLYTTPDFENEFRKHLAHKMLTGKIVKYGGNDDQGESI